MSDDFIESCALKLILGIAVIINYYNKDSYGMR